MLAGQAANLQLIHGATEGRPGGPCPVFLAGDLPGLAAADARDPGRHFPRSGIGFVPRRERYGAGGKTWRHISQSGRVPPVRRLAPQHHECQQGEPGLTLQPHLQESLKLGLPAMNWQMGKRMPECGFAGSYWA